MDAYTRLPPEEQRIIQVTLLASAAVLWLALAWEEVMLLFALPVLVGLGFLLVRTARRYHERRKGDYLY